jgi:hypothetical protein
VPDAWRANTPAGLAERMRDAKARGLFPPFPFGSDFTEIEQYLLPALLWLKKSTSDWRRWPTVLSALIAPGTNNDAAAPALERLGLSQPANVAERLLARLVRGALARSGGQSPRN